MSWLEIIGVAGLWVIGTIVLTYIGVFITAFLTRKGGLGTMVLLIVPGIGIPVVSLVALLVYVGYLFGRAA